MKLTESNSVNLDKPLAESAVAPGECGSVPRIGVEPSRDGWFGRRDQGMQPPNNQPNLICKSCGVDRSKEDCKGDRLRCGLASVAHSDHVAVISAEPESRVPDGFLPMESAPLDGTEILLLTKIGIVSAWFAKGEWTEHFETGREYTGAQWICYDDAFQIEVEETEHGNFSEAIGWMPKPGQSGISSLDRRPNEKTFADKTGTFADTSYCFVVGEGK